VCGSADDDDEDEKVWDDAEADTGCCTDGASPSHSRISVRAAVSDRSSGTGDFVSRRCAGLGDSRCRCGDDDDDDDDEEDEDELEDKDGGPDRGVSSP